MLLDGWASEPQYLAHIAPVWLALPESLQGHLYALQGFDLPAGLPPDLPGLYRGPERPYGPNPVLVASWPDHAGVAPARTVFLEHGAGQVYDDASNPSYSGGDKRERALLFLVPSERVAERNLARYPDIPNAVVGCPVLDRYHQLSSVEQRSARRPHKPEVAGSNPVAATTAPFGGRAATSGAGRQPLEARPRSLPSKAEGAVACLSFHWDDVDGPPERRSAFAHYEPVLADVARAFPGAIGHAHPRWFNQIAWPMERAGLEPVRDFDEVIERADIYCCDNSSTMFEWASLDRPVVVLNQPAYRRDVDLFPRFWDCADVGLQVDEPGQLVGRITEALEDAEPVRRNRQRAVDAVYAHHRDGRASERAAQAIAARLAGLTEEELVPDPYGPVTAPPVVPARLDAPGHPPIPRMRDAGATEAECAEADRLWQSMSEHDRWETTDAMNSWTDEELRQNIIDGRVAPVVNTVDPPEGTVAEVRAWIGTDPARARRALEAEQQRSRVRAGVTEYVEEVLDG